MQIHDEVVEVVMARNDVLLGVYALDKDGERVVQLPVTRVDTHYSYGEPGVTTVDLFSFRVVTTREVDSREL